MLLNKEDSTNIESSHRSFHIREKRTKNWSKLLLEQLYCNGETGNGEIFRIFPFSEFAFDGQSI